MEKYQVWAKFNGKWKLIETFDNSRLAKRKMRELVYLYYAEAATIEVIQE